MGLPRSQVLLRIFSAAIVAGVAVGILGSVFRMGLDAANGWRETAVSAAHAFSWAGFAAVVAVTACAAMFARVLVVRFAPIAAGSGVQHVEAVMREEAEPAVLAVLPVKFIGGLVTLGAGLPLGREGPTVQMGAVLGHLMGSRFVHDPEDRKAIFAAGAGAGLGVAFNTPVGAAVFVFEELTRRFRPLQVLATLAAATVAMAIMQAVLGEAILFHAGPSAVQPLAQLPVHFVLGACLGIAGVAYATLTTWFLDVADRMRAVGSVLRAGIIGAVIGAVGWFFPHLIGGGEGLVELILTEKATVTLMLSVLAARVVLSPLSYAAGVPGGLFAPLLVLGAACGTLGAHAAAAALPALAPDGVTMAVVGMAAIFTAVVRAPLTGIVLTIEMTGRADCALAMLTACLAATLFASLVGGQPIYDVLRERMLASGAGRSSTR